MKKALMIIAMVAIVAIAGSMIYYFVFFRPGVTRAEIRLQEENLKYEKEQKALEQKNIEQEKKDKEQAEINQKTKLLDALIALDKWHQDSLNQAYKDYRIQWDNECTRLGKKPESPLPTATADTFNEYYNQAIKRIDESYQSQKDDIYKLYE